jgi:hypothetical protein
MIHVTPRANDVEIFVAFLGEYKWFDWDGTRNDLDFIVRSAAEDIAETIERERKEIEPRRWEELIDWDAWKDAPPDFANLRTDLEDLHRLEKGQARGSTIGPPRLIPEPSPSASRFAMNVSNALRRVGASLAKKARAFREWHRAWETRRPIASAAVKVPLWFLFVASFGLFGGLDRGWLRIAVIVAVMFGLHDAEQRIIGRREQGRTWEERWVAGASQRPGRVIAAEFAMYFALMVGAGATFGAIEELGVWWALALAAFFATAPAGLTLLSIRGYRKRQRFRGGATSPS